jgi:outer membrane murein-binding lipoprotein Lpp
MKDILENWKKYVITEKEGSGEETFVLKLPKLRISEEWGKPKSEDREQIARFTKQIKGDDLATKIESLNSFASRCDKACANTKDVAEILGNLVFLDALSSVIYDFNAQTGGFLFEALLAALLGGDARQVATAGGPNQDVTDIFDDKGRPMSLKFFFDTGSKNVGGSYNNLNQAIEDNKSVMYYLVALKQRAESGDVMSIDFYEFTVGNENYRGDFTLSDWRSAKAETQFKIPVNTEIKIPGYKLGNLNFGSRTDIANIAGNYVDKLSGTLRELYGNIDYLSKNVNAYFLENEAGAATRAKKAAKTIKGEADKLA